MAAWTKIATGVAGTGRRAEAFHFQDKFLPPIIATHRVGVVVLELAFTGVADGF
jgi:hypothetical protein